MYLKCIPSMFTAANLIFGVVSLNYTIHGNYYLASIAILFCMILDSLDGRIARMLGVSSEFGKELDSLADVVSFGVAPALLINTHVLTQFGLIGFLAVLWFATAGGLRLARFNIQESSGYFVGVPITAAGSLLALFNLIANLISPWGFLIGTIILGVLMVSKFKVPKL